jgi:hypothetical protein
VLCSEKYFYSRLKSLYVGQLTQVKRQCAALFGRLQNQPGKNILGLRFFLDSSYRQRADPNIFSKTNNSLFLQARPFCNCKLFYFCLQESILKSHFEIVCVNYPFLKNLIDEKINLKTKS